MVSIFMRRTCHRCRQQRPIAGGRMIKSARDRGRIGKGTLFVCAECREDRHAANHRETLTKG